LPHFPGLNFAKSNEFWRDNLQREGRAVKNYEINKREWINKYGGERIIRLKENGIRDN
jgi:hypothetical protein